VKKIGWRSGLAVITAVVITNSTGIVQAQQPPLPYGFEFWSPRDNCAYIWNGSAWERGNWCRRFLIPGNASLFDLYSPLDPQGRAHVRIDLRQPGWVAFNRFDAGGWIKYPKNPNSPYQTNETYDPNTALVFSENQWKTMAQLVARINSINAEVARSQGPAPTQEDPQGRAAIQGLIISAMTTSAARRRDEMRDEDKRRELKKYYDDKYYNNKYYENERLNEYYKNKAIEQDRLKREATKAAVNGNDLNRAADDQAAANRAAESAAANQAAANRAAESAAAARAAAERARR